MLTAASIIVKRQMGGGGRELCAPVWEAGEEAGGCGATSSAQREATCGEEAFGKDGEGHVVPARSLLQG